MSITLLTLNEINHIYTDFNPFRIKILIFHYLLVVNIQNLQFSMI